MKRAFIILFLAAWVSTASAQGPGTRSAGGCVAASSSGTTYTCNFTVDPGNYLTHQAYFVTADIANTGAVTWNVNSHGAKSVVKMIGGATTALVANDIRAGQELLLVYDGANLQVLSGIGNIPVAIHGFGASFDGGVAALTAGKTVYTTVPYACAIKAWNITVSPADTAKYGTPGPLSFRDCSAEQRKEENRGAPGDIYQKTVAIESSYRDEGGGNRRVHDRLDRPARQAVAAVRGLRAAMPGGPQCEKGAGLARPVAAEVALETALPPPPGRVPTVRCARGGLSVGGTLGASDDGAVQCRRHLGAGTELAGERHASMV